MTASHEGVFLRCMGGIVDGLERRRFRPAGRLHAAGNRPDPQELAQSGDRLSGVAAPIRQCDLIYFWEVGTDSTNYFMGPSCASHRFSASAGAGRSAAARPRSTTTSPARRSLPTAPTVFSREPLHRLPHLPAYALPLRQQPPVSPPEQFGLAKHANIYLCAQNLRKVHPDFDEALGGILRADRRAVAVFVHDKSPLLGAALQQRWRRTLADIADRLVILPRLTPDDYICLVASATVILDTPYFGGSNTVYDTSAVGVPVVTLPGETPASRYTAALHRSMGIDDGVAGSVADYIDRALRLGTDRSARDSLASRIRAANPAVFQNRGAVEQLEAFFTAVLTRFADR